MRFDKQHLEPKLRNLRLPPGSITTGGMQLRLHPKRLGNKWREVLEEVLNVIT
jgi:hypothetical protein